MDLSIGISKFEVLAVLFKIKIKKITLMLFYKLWVDALMN